MPATATDAEASASWRALGTLVQLVVTDPAALPGARRLLEDDLAAVDATCSRFRDDSEIRSLTGGRRRISPLLAEALGVALRAARLTDGDVDPTVGAAMSAAGYDRDFRQIEPNGPPLRLTVRQVPGWREIRLDGRSLTLPGGVQLDLGATAKAWAADRSVTRIAAQTDSGVLVSLGGDIAVAGPPPAHPRPRRGGRGLQPVPRRLRDPLAARRPAAGQPAAGRGRRGGAAGGQADRRRRGPDGGRGHGRGRVRP